jgi:hypothetical protein
LVCDVAHGHIRFIELGVEKKFNTGGLGVREVVSGFPWLLGKSAGVGAVGSGFGIENRELEGIYLGGLQII